MKYSIIILLIAALVQLIEGDNILMVTLGNAKSHKITFTEITKALSTKGHTFTIISAFPANENVSGVTEIAPAQLVDYVEEYTRRDKFDEFYWLSEIFEYKYQSCNKLLNSVEVRNYLQTKPKVDLIIIDSFLPECAFAFVRYFKKEVFFYVNTIPFYIESLSLSGQTQPYSVNPFFTLPYTDEMNLYQRTINFIYHSSSKVDNMMAINQLQDIVEVFLGEEIPSLFTIATNVSLIFQNADLIATGHGTYYENVITTGCIQCRPGKPLPKAVEEFINGSGEAGFIFVSLGAHVRTLPNETLKAFVEAFKALPQRVIWKLSTDNKVDSSENIMIGTEFPQQDLLAHPKIRAFITNGGIHSLMETIYHAVPIIAMPIYGDQFPNTARAEKDGYAILVDINTLTTKTLLEATNKLIHNTSYKEVVAEMQGILKDNIDTPLERATYWIEYALRHDGAPHIRALARDLDVLRFHLVDVYAAIIVAALIILYIFTKLFLLIFRMFKGPILQSKATKID